MNFFNNLYRENVERVQFCLEWLYDKAGKYINT